MAGAAAAAAEAEEEELDAAASAEAAAEAEAGERCSAMKLRMRRRHTTDRPMSATSSLVSSSKSLMCVTPHDSEVRRLMMEEGSALEPPLSTSSLMSAEM